MKNKELKAKIIAEVCAEQDLDPNFISALIELESDHGDLLAWGARPSLRRDVGVVVDEYLAKSRSEGTDEASSG